MLIKQTSNLNSPSRRVNIFTANLMVSSLMVSSLMFAGITANAATPKANQVEVRIDPYDLKSDRGIARVYKRLQSKAQTACATPGRQPLTQIRVAKVCSADLLGEFVSGLDHDRLTHYHLYKVSQRT